MTELKGYDIGGDATISKRNEALFWIFAVLAMGIFLGHNALWGSENRWAEISREMLLTGDVLHPAINWRIYFDKPQLTYWFILPFAWLLDGGELASRIPSALAGLAGLYGAMVLARRFFDRRIALLTGWLLLSSYGFLFWARCAAADMANLAAIVLAVAWFFQVEKQPGFRGYFGFYLIAFVGALAKGLPALVMPFVVVAPYALDHGRFKAHLKWSNLVAFLLAAAIYALPFGLAAWLEPAAPLAPPPDHDLSGWELVWRENIVRVFNAFDHRDPVYTYIYELPRLMLPWSPLIIVAVAGLIRNRKRLSREAGMLALGAVLMFILFCLSQSRRWYYLLPLAPFCAMFGAAGILSPAAELRWTRPAVEIMRYIALTAGALALASLVALPVWNLMFPGTPLPLITMVTLPLSGLLVLGVMLLDQPPENCSVSRWIGLPPRVASMVVGTAILVVAMFSCVLPSFTVYRSEKPFFLELRDFMEQNGIEPEQLVFFAIEPYASGVYYLDLQRPARVLQPEFAEDQPAEVLRAWADETPGRRLALLTRNREAMLTALANTMNELGVELDLDRPLRQERKISLTGRKPAKEWRMWLVEIPALPAAPSESGPGDEPQKP